MKNAFFVLFVLLLLVSCNKNEDKIASNTYPEIGKVSFESSDTLLVNAFNWAKKTALSFVHSGDPVGLWYEAALPNREAFCMRDVSHQSIGAAVLGLYQHNHNMLYKFAENISEEKDWCSYWEINRFDKPAPVDYENDKDFWYNLPANFDVIDACFQQYLWTGNKEYLNDSVFLNFYKKSLNNYMERWQIGISDVYTRDRKINLPDNSTWDNTRFYSNRGIPGYYEGARKGLKLGVDLVAAQFAAFNAYQQILKMTECFDSSYVYIDQLGGLMYNLNTKWWDEDKQLFKTIWYEDDSFDYSVGRNKQDFSHYLLHYRSISDRKQIESILNTYKPKKFNYSIEIASHLPDMFYQYGDKNDGYDLLVYLTDEKTKRKEYPENSYAVIGAFATGLMGLNVHAPSNIITSISRLNSESDWAVLNHIPVLANEINLKHNGLRQTEIQLLKGNYFTWKVCFEGKYENITVDGITYKSNFEEAKSGSEVTYILLPIKDFKLHIAKVN